MFPSIPKPLRPFVFAASCAIVFPTLISGSAYAVFSFGLLIGLPEPLSGFAATVTGVVLAALAATLSIATFERLLKKATK